MSSKLYTPEGRIFYVDKSYKPPGWYYITQICGSKNITSKCIKQKNVDNKKSSWHKQHHNEWLQHIS